MPRRRGPEGKRAFAFSLILHGTVFAVAWLSTMNAPAPIEFIAYEIELVSPPPAQQAEESTPPVEEFVVERPEPEPPAPEPEPETAVLETPEPEPPPPEPEPEPTPPEPEAEPEPATTVEAPPEEEAETSGEGINVRLEGLRRDYPEYYNNIIRQIGRCFYPRWRQGGSWETVIAFTLARDGIASDLDFLQRSGNVEFDFIALEAVGDCAGQGRFGPLPEDFEWEGVRIAFTFEPPNEQ